MTSIGLTWNSEIRDNGTAFYFRRALERMVAGGGLAEVKHYQARGEVGKHDWYFYVDDGRDDLKWLPPHPCAYYAIDTHLGYGYRLWKARHFDRVFVAQKDAVAQMKHDGVPWVEWLPLACDPEHHATATELQAKGVPDSMLEREWDAAFVGFLRDDTHPAMNNRIEYLDTLFREIPKSWLSVNVFHEGMALRYVKSRVGFNVSVKRDLNMRVFEVMSTGTPLLTNRNVEGIEELFEDGVHYVGYEGPQEAVERAKWMLAHRDEANAIGRCGHAEVRARHTYRHRVETIAAEMEKAA
mgnify:CR=1 FL=1